jgi:DNA-binding transcriptional LysR family regulator
VTVVGAPAYFARRRPPRAPDDLVRHSCVQYRLAADRAVFEWALERDGRSRRLAVDGPVIVNDPDLVIRAAVDGLGIAYTVEALADPLWRSGQLVRVLEDWSPSFEGLFLYYTSHRQVPVALGALINMLRISHGSAPVKGELENHLRGRVNPLSAAVAAGRLGASASWRAGYS